MSNELEQPTLPFLQTIADYSPVQIWTARPDGQLDYVNRRVAEFCGRSPAEVVGAGWMDILHPADVQRTVARWRHSLTTGETYIAEFRILGGDGAQYHWFQVEANPVRNDAGQIISWVGTNTDIDSLKRAIESSEARQEISRQQIAHLLDRLDKLKDSNEKP